MTFSPIATATKYVAEERLAALFQKYETSSRYAIIDGDNAHGFTIKENTGSLVWRVIKGIAHTVFSFGYAYYNDESVRELFKERKVKQFLPQEIAHEQETPLLHLDEQPATIEVLPRVNLEEPLLEISTVTSEIDLPIVLPEESTAPSESAALLAESIASVESATSSESRASSEENAAPLAESIAPSESSTYPEENATSSEERIAPSESTASSEESTASSEESTASSESIESLETKDVQQLDIQPTAMENAAQRIYEMITPEVAKTQTESKPAEHMPNSLSQGNSRPAADIMETAPKLGSKSRRAPCPLPTPVIKEEAEIPTPTRSAPSLPTRAKKNNETGEQEDLPPPPTRTLSLPVQENITAEQEPLTPAAEKAARNMCQEIKDSSGTNLRTMQFAFEALKRQKEQLEGLEKNNADRIVLKLEQLITVAQSVKEAFNNAETIDDILEVYLSPNFVLYGAATKDFVQHYYEAAIMCEKDAIYKNTGAHSGNPSQALNATFQYIIKHQQFVQDFQNMGILKAKECLLGLNKAVQTMNSLLN